MRVNAWMGAPIRSGPYSGIAWMYWSQLERGLGDELRRRDRALSGARMPTDLRQLLLHGSPFRRLRPASDAPFADAGASQGRNTGNSLTLPVRMRQKDVVRRSTTRYRR